MPDADAEQAARAWQSADADVESPAVDRASARYQGRVSSPTTVIWTDFGGVLTPPVDDALRRVADAARVPPEELLGAIGRVAAEDDADLLEPLERGWISQRDWGRRVTVALAPGWVPAIDLGSFGDYWYADRPFNTVLYEALLAARTSGLRLGMLTNSVREWEVHRARMIPDRTVFDRIVNSHEVGVRKPDPAIYRLAERSLGVSAGECLLIDDLPGNCAAAIACGWRAIRHVDTGTTVTALGNLLETSW
ncbi:MAG TPA: HAD family phosphatase [Pseudonocardiaceae bacterium]|jgi:putative hydrolase of the HAD superfamily|nr:HAD family phosphatase [Pseudonocardiaceae bacterium]